MSKLFSASFKSIVILVFACSAVPVFAQHGGGHGGGGGGFHGGGGGGFHGGGGMRSGGGGAPRGGSYSGPAAGYRGSTAGAPSAPRSANGYYSRPGGNFAGGNERYGNSSSGSPGVANGQWHSFAGTAGSRGPAGAPSGAGSPGSAGGFHVFSANRGTGSSGAVRSFSGQGGEVWENSSGARNVVPKSQSLSTLHNSFSGSTSVNSRLRPNSTLSASSRAAGATTFTGNRAFSSGLNAANAFQARNTFRFGNRFNRFNRFGFGGGCWNCGFGFGFGGWGFGGPWLGFGFWNPFWINPWWGFGPAYGYGYYAYPDSNVYGYPDSGYPATQYNSNPPPPDQYQDQYQGDEESPNGNWVTPNGPSPSSAPNSANLTVPVLIYLKSGAVYTVRDYWMVEGVLHFIQINGAQNSIDLQQVDLPRTNTENAKSGVKFIYKSSPASRLSNRPARANHLQRRLPRSSRTRSHNLRRTPK
jgi:hypothetical protein